MMGTGVGSMETLLEVVREDTSEVTFELTLHSGKGSSHANSKGKKFQAKNNN